MSQAPNSCVKNQAAGSQPVLANSTVVGLNLRLYKHVANVSGESMFYFRFQYKHNITNLLSCPVTLI